MTNKYKLGDLAKDFDISSKELATTLSGMTGKAYNASKALDESELNLVFEHLTQTHPIASIEVIYADTYQEPKKEQPVLELSLYFDIYD